MLATRRDVVVLPTKKEEGQRGLREGAKRNPVKPISHGSSTKWRKETTTVVVPINLFD